MLKGFCMNQRKASITGKKVLVAGAGGFIGSHIARALYKNGNYVRAVDVKWDNFIKEPHFSKALTMDLRNFDNCKKATEGMDYVFNFAANMGGIGYITRQGANIMHDSSMINLNLLNCSVKNNIERFFYASSACVYPEHLQLESDVRPLKEADAYPAMPDTYYGWEKLYTERLCEAFSVDYGLKTRIARYHNIYGPESTFDGGREKAPSALCRKVALATNPGAIEVWGDGEQTRSFCYIDDCVNATLALASSSYEMPINVGSDRLVTINQLADMIIAISGKKIAKNHNTKGAQGVRGRNADISLIKEKLGWEPKVSLEKGLEKTYRWTSKEIIDRASPLQVKM